MYISQRQLIAGEDVPLCCIATATDLGA